MGCGEKISMHCAPYRGAFRESRLCRFRRAAPPLSASTQREQAKNDPIFLETWDKLDAMTHGSEFGSWGPYATFLVAVAS